MNGSLTSSEPITTHIEVSIPNPLPRCSFQLPGQPSSSTTSFAHRHAGGQALHGDSIVVWNVSSSEPIVLSISAFSEPRDTEKCAVRLLFPSAIFPQVLWEVDQGILCAFVLCENEVLYRIRLHWVGSNQSGGINLHSPSDFTDTFDLSSEIQRLGGVTSWVKLERERVICIGGRSGTIACCPLASFDRGQSDYFVELKDAGTTIQRFLGGIFTKQSLPGVADLCTLTLHGTERLVALYSDQTLRVWDVAKQQRVLVGTLGSLTSLPGAEPASLRVVPTDASTSAHLLAVEFRMPAAGPDASSFAVYELETEKANSPTFAFSLQLRSLVTDYTVGVVDYTLRLGDEGLQLWLLYSGLEGTQLKICLIEDDEPTTSVCSLVESEWRRYWDEVKELKVLDDLFSRFQSCLPHGTTSGDSLVNAAVKHVVWKLLGPTLYCPDTLRDTLSQLGHQITVTELSGMDPEDVVARIAATIKTTGPAAAGGRSLERLSQLLKVYCQCWQRGHAACAVLVDRVSQQVLIIRGRASVSVVRQALPLEQVLCGGCPEGVSSSGLYRLHECMSKLAQMLGMLTCDAVQGVLLGGCDPAAHLLPAVTRMVLEGPLPQSLQLGKPASRDEIRDNGAWRKLRRRTLCDVANLLRSINVRDAFSTFTQLFSVENSSMTEEPYSKLYLQQALVVASWQVAEARLEASLKLSMLLSLLVEQSDMGGLGTWERGVPHDYSKEYAKACCLLRQSTALSWLLGRCCCPASQSSDPHVLLHNLRLEPTGGMALRPLSPRPVHAKRVFPRDLLAQDFVASSPGSTSWWDLSQCAVLFIEHLVGKPALEEAATEASGKLLRVCAKLYHDRHLTPLLQLLALMGSQKEISPSLQFFKGYCLAHRLRGALDDDARAQVTEQSIRHFTHATTLFAGGSARLQDPEASVVIGCVRGLMEELTGTYTQEAQQMLCVQYWEALMMMYERLGCYQGAVHCARSALQLLQHVSCEDPQDEAQLHRQARLWDNLFAYALDAQDYEAAYGALLYNPVAERKLDCLQRLVHSMCNAGETRQLCKLPYVGNCKVSAKDGSGKLVTVSLLDEVHSVLQRRANTLDLAAHPQPYKVLYDWCTCRGNYQSAAVAMLTFARRMETEWVDRAGVVQQMQEALGAALCSLSVVEPAIAFLYEPRHSSSDRSEQRQSGRGSVLDDMVEPEQVPIVDVAQLAREYALVAAKSLLCTCGSSEGTVVSMNTQQVAAQLLTAGQYDAAVDLCHTTLEGPDTLSLLCTVLKHIAATAVTAHRLHNRQDTTASHAGTTFWDADQPSASSARPASPCGPDPLWAIVRRALQGRPACERTRLATAVTQGVLATERRIKLPLWLVEEFEGHGVAGGAPPGGATDPAALMRLYMQHDRLVDAAQVALRAMARYREHGAQPGAPELRSCTTWFPYTLLSALLQAMAGAGAAPVREWHQKLAAEVASHVTLVEHQSTRLMQSHKGVAERLGFGG